MEIGTNSLASYDLFPMFAVQPGQTTLLNHPSQVEVYIDSNTQQLNTHALAPGNTPRFYGLVFNDNGTLRMDCTQVNDGVTANSQASSAVAVDDFTQAVRRAFGGLVLKTVIDYKVRDDSATERRLQKCIRTHDTSFEGLLHSQRHSGGESVKPSTLVAPSNAKKKKIAL